MNINLVEHIIDFIEIGPGISMITKFGILDLLDKLKILWFNGQKHPQKKSWECWVFWQGFLRAGSCLEVCWFH